MKRTLIIIILIFSLSFILLGSDRIYRAVYDFQEIFTYVDDTLDFKTRQDIIHLDLLPDRSYCYSKYTWFTDSLNMQPDGEKIWMMLFKAYRNNPNRDSSSEPSYPHMRNTFQITKKYKEKEMSVIDFFDNQYFEYQESIPQFEWMITDSIKNINGLQCISAQCSTYGRDWTVWFCPDLPCGDGPWKFSGLPGLVVEAYDSNHFYKFKLTQIHSISNPVTPWGKNPKKTTRSKFNKQKYDYLQNLDGNLNAEFGIEINYSQNSPKRYRIGLENDYSHK